MDRISIAKVGTVKEREKANNLMHLNNFENSDSHLNMDG